MITVNGFEATDVVTAYALIVKRSETNAGRQSAREALRRLFRDVHEVLDASWDARYRGDLVTALVLDDIAEDMGTNSDNRATCYSCQTWANHSHPFLYPMSTKVYEWPQTDSDQVGGIASKVYSVQTATVN